VHLTGIVRTPDPAGLALRTGRHFAHKVPVEERSNSRRIHTRFGVIELEPAVDGLHVTLVGEQLDELRGVAVTHLERFARDGFDVQWDSPEPAAG
jgi:hypothetical protein